MNRFTLLACVSLTAISLSGQMAAAEDFKPYVSVFAGASLPGRLTATDTGGTKYDIGLNTGYLIGAAIGTQVTDQLRAELELSRAFYKGADGHSTYDGGSNFGLSGGIHATYLMANAWLDIPTNSAITPYIGGGVGAGWIGGDPLLFGSSSTFGIGREKAAGLAFQVGGGVKFDVSTNVAIDVGYRFKDIIGASAYNSQSGAEAYEHMNLASHNVQVGLTYKF
jgi:opacity protein-like surface antigen